MAFLKDTKHLSIPFQDIESATNNFKTPIGNGGFGKVYKGELSLSGKLTSVAVKRLDTKLGQGDKQFLTEIQLLSRCNHQNLVSLVGFCREGQEYILVYEYAEHGSLDNYHHVEGKTCSLTWKQRINICIDAARGLNYLHNDVAEKERIIHRDLKSANILLDHNWKAMIADFGLSKLGRANEDVTYVITNVCGTPGYCDPLYMDTGVLTKESDVYSFGVVLFEVLCGRLGFRNVDNEHRFLAQLAQHYYDKGKLYEIIDPCLKNQMDLDSMNAVSEIAIQCLNKNRVERPSMDFVVDKLVEALEIMKVDDKEIEWDNYLPSDYKQFIYYSNKEMMAIPPKDVNFPTKEEAYSILSKGVRIKVENGVDMWFWITKSNGKKCFMLSPDAFSGLTCWFKSAPASPNESRFGKVLFKENAHDISMMFKLIYPLLSTKTAYACYLVYKMQNDPCFEQPWDVIVYCHHMKKEDMHLGIPVSDKRPFCVFQSKKTRKIFLRRPQSPLIKPGDGLIEDYSNPLNKNIEFPRKRKDGWWEVSLGEFISDYMPYDETTGITSVRPDYDSRIQIKICQSGTFKKVILQTIEFRPL